MPYRDAAAPLLKAQDEDAAVRAGAESAVARAPALHPTLALQRSIGNHTVQRLFSSDRDAGERARAMAASASPAEPAHATLPPLLQLQRQVGNRLMARVVDERFASDAASDGLVAVEQSIEQARGSGQGLESDVRGHMESAFGADFGGVRIHTDGRSDSLNRALGARAFATGRDVFFRHGEYRPGSSGGQELLAHELTHVVQQGGAVQRSVEQQRVQRTCPVCEERARLEGLQAKLEIGSPDDAYEQEADRVAKAVVQRSALIQRDPGDDDNDRPEFPPDWQHGAPTRPIEPDPHVAPDPNRQPESPPQSPYRTPGLRDQLVTALGIVLGLAVFVALAVCFATGACEAGLILAAAGAGAYLIVVGILRSMGVGVSGGGTTTASQEAAPDDDTATA